MRRRCRWGGRPRRPPCHGWSVRSWPVCRASSPGLALHRHRAPTSLRHARRWRRHPSRLAWLGRRHRRACVGFVLPGIGDDGCWLSLRSALHRMHRRERSPSSRWPCPMVATTAERLLSQRQILAGAAGRAARPGRPALKPASNDRSPPPSWAARQAARPSEPTEQAARRRAAGRAAPSSWSGATSSSAAPWPSASAVPAPRRGTHSTPRWSPRFQPVVRFRPVLKSRAVPTAPAKSRLDSAAAAASLAAELNLSATVPPRAVSRMPPCARRWPNRRRMVAGQQEVRRDGSQRGAGSGVPESPGMMLGSLGLPTKRRR